MTEPKQPKKRVVSKPVYLAYLARTTTLASGSVLLGIGGIVCSVISIVGAVNYLWFPKGFDLDLLFTWILLWGFAAAMFIVGAVATGKAIKKIEPVLPPTRQNMEQLPNSETLLRASAEPTEGQEKVLLRAATAGAETPPEQLLRPTVAE